MATNKRLLTSKSRGDLNQCTPSWGNLIHMTHTLPTPIHVHHSYASYRQSTYVATFHRSSTASDRVTAPKKKDLLTTSPGRRLTYLQVPIQFLSPSEPLKYWRKPNIRWQTSYINLLGPYQQHVISTFNTYSRGPTHRSLTNTDESYNLEGAGLPHHTPYPSQPMVLCFPPKGPSHSQINHPTLPTGLKMEQTLNLMSGSLL
jgi:hypothetical protein